MSDAEEDGDKGTGVVVGTPRREVERWESVDVRFNQFERLPSAKGEVVESPEFACLGQRWSLDLYPGGHHSAADGMVSAYLFNVSEDVREMRYSLRVYDVHGNEVAGFDPPGVGNYGWGESGFMRRSELVKHLIDGALFVEVAFRVEEEDPRTFHVPENPVCGHIRSMFNEEESADVLFEVSKDYPPRGGEGDDVARKRARESVSFYAHRLILRKCAPDFAIMCGSGGGEHRTTVPITDIEPDVFRHLLYYIYGGEVTHEDMGGRAREVLDASDKYGVVGLKLVAEVCLVKATTLTPHNVADELVYAEARNCALLKESIMDYMVKNHDDIIGKVSFDHVPGTVVSDLLAALARGKGEAGPGGAEGERPQCAYNKKSVGYLRWLLDVRGLDVDGSREALIARLKESNGTSPDPWFGECDAQRRCK